MGKTVHSVKLIPYDSASLAQVSYSNGDVVYDNTNKTIRVMDGINPGGRQLLKNDLSNIATSGGTVNFGSSTITASGFIGQISSLSNHAISDLSDVNTTGSTAGQILSYDGTNWVPISLSGNFNGGTIAADLNSTSTSNSTSGTTGAFNTLGGVGVTLDLYVGGDINLAGKLNAIGDIVAKNRGVLQLNNTANTAAVSLTVASGLATSVTFILPGVYGSAGQVLTTNGSGVLSWSTPSGGGAGGGSAGGPTNSIQYNNGVGGFDGQSTFTYDLATDTVSATTFSGHLTSSSIAVTGGSINGTTLGASVQASASVTSLAASDVVTVTDNTNSTTTSTGAVVVSGGVGVAQDMVIGGSVTVNTSITSTGDINANANVLISTVPTEPTHATNKSYVDTRALALAVAMS